jgi:membrane-associated PAP2 superfamily phosphatase
MQFGGHASWVSHWAWGVRDGGPGHCFPAGHASAAFAFVSGYFVLRSVSPAQARGWLVGSLLAGLLLGAAQQLRGAHFMSHTLWTGWFCWTTAWLVDTVVRMLDRETVSPYAAEAPPETLT